MRPFVRDTIKTVAAEHGVSPELIAEQCRRRPVVLARREVMRRLHACGRYSAAQIGRFLNHDHTTVLYAIGCLQKKPSKPPWSAPVIRHLHCQGCRLCFFPTPRPAPEVEEPIRPKEKRYLIPYVGADFNTYRWIERP